MNDDCLGPGEERRGALRDLHWASYRQTVTCAAVLGLAWTSLTFASALRGASHERSETIRESPHAYQISVGGSLDHEITRSHQGYALPWLEAFQPNRYVAIANVGREDILNPRLTVDGRGAWSTRTEILSSIVGPGMPAEEIALSLWAFLVDNVYRVEESWGVQYVDPVVALNTYGFAECIGRATLLCHLAREAGLEASLSGPGHWAARLTWDGESHFLDPDRATFFRRPDREGLASELDLVTDHHQVRLTHTDWIGHNDHPRVDSAYAEIFSADRYSDDPHTPSPRDMSLRLRPGETINRSWQNWGKFSSYCFGPASHDVPPLFFGNGQLLFIPDLTDTLFRHGAEEVTGLSCVADDGLLPYLRPASVGIPGSLVLRMESPYVIVGGTIRGTAIRGSPDDVCRILVSRDGSTWQEAWRAEMGQSGFTIGLDDWVDPRHSLWMFEFWLRLELLASEDVTLTGLDSLAVEADFQLAPRFLPALLLGENEILYTDQNAGERDAIVTYGWEESESTHPPERPVLTYPTPEGPSVPLRPTFDWAEALDPDGDLVNEYRIQVSERADFRWPVSPNFDRYISKTLHAGETAWVPPYHGLLAPGIIYFWRVSARDEKGAWSAWSAPLSFVASGPGRPGTLERIIQGKRILLQWTAPPSGNPPAGYQIYGSNEQGFTPCEENFVADATRTSFEVVTPVPAFPNQNRIFYRVIAVDPAGVAGAASDCFEMPHPFIFSEPPTIARVGQLYAYAPGILTARKFDRSPADDSLIVAAVTLPPWLHELPPGTLEGLPQAQDEGLWPVVLRVSDSRGGETTQSFEIRVEGQEGTSEVFPLSPGCNLIARSVDAGIEDPASAFADVVEQLTYAMDFCGSPHYYFPDLPESSSLAAVISGGSYWLRVTGCDTLIACGQAQEPYGTPLELHPGWNLVPFLPHTADSLTHAFSALGDNVEAVLAAGQSGTTHDRDLPEWSTLTLLHPGHGYWVKLTAADTLTYPGDTACPLMSGGSSGRDAEESQENPVCRSPYWALLYGSDLLVQDLPVPAGTPIEVCDPSGVFCGTGEFSSPGRFGFLTVWRDDPATPEDEGAMPGDALRFRAGAYEPVSAPIFSAFGERIRVSGTLFPATAPQDPLVLGLSATNPSTETVLFRVVLPDRKEIALELYAPSGRRVRSVARGLYPPGETTILWDGRDVAGRLLAPGIYLARLTCGSERISRKIVMVR